MTQREPVRTNGTEIVDLVVADMWDRKALGMERYGIPLTPFNGRSALVDAYEEALDLCVYLRQLIEEERQLAAR